MSKLAKQLIEKEKRERTGRLDIGKCGLTDLEKEVPELFECIWLEELNLSNKWRDRKQDKWEESKNKDIDNRLSHLPPSLPLLLHLKILRIGGSYRGRQISDISSLEKLTGLQNLMLNYNQISDLSPLEKLTGLQSLELSNNQISDLSSLQKLTGLQSLELSNNQISDLSSLQKLTGLQSLDLSVNKIKDVNFLEKLTGLQSLGLSNNQISDLSSLQKLTGLQSLR
ncbi:MAG: leucine-rich repeat domain-containing protein [Saprospiraceae bacterium]|nr:leucine-rich repeat domain-containing protein [Saprospiraceae bacterium]